jgi:hypothetical protein
MTCYAAAASVPVMDTVTSERHLAFDLLETDLDDEQSVAALIARHAVAPARQMFGMTPPELGETIESFLLSGRFTLMLGNLQPTWSKDPTAATLEPLLRGLVLFGKTFPGALRTLDLSDGWVATTPGAALPARAMTLAVLRWGELAFLAASVLGRPARLDPPSWSIQSDWLASRAGLDDLRSARSVVERALTPPDDSGEMVAREEVGLQAVDVLVADEIDEILRRDARVRLVRVTDVEAVLADEQIDHPDAPDLYEPLTVERGVFPMTLPESIAGLVAVDLVEAFRRGRSTGICGLCGRPFLLESQQVSLARRGQHVYHPSCFAERRRRYMRDYRAGRVGPNADVNSTSRLSVSTVGS